jgi:hypothetical protein
VTKVLNWVLYICHINFSPGLNIRWQKLLWTVLGSYIFLSNLNKAAGTEKVWNYAKYNP